MKKIFYSEPLRQMSNMYNDWCNKFKKHDLVEYYNFIRYVYIPQHPPMIQQAQRLLLNFWLKYYQGEFLHVWLLDSDLVSFLGEEVDLKDLQGIKRFLLYKGQQHSVTDPLTNDQYCYVKYDIALHIPNVNNGSAFSFCYMPDGTVALFCETNDGVVQIHESQFEDACSQDDESSKQVVKAFRFAVSLLSYMACFPECVKDGVPETNKDKKFTPKGKSVQLGVADKIAPYLKDHSGATKRPHLRRGYFKVLSSEFFTNKRGQIIFVHETMVKGRSKTVKMSDDVEKIENFKNDK